LYTAPYSDSGNQSVWMTIVSGHTAPRSTEPPVGCSDVGGVVVASTSDGADNTPVTTNTVTSRLLIIDRS
jgi:hypothetical protein